MVPNHPAYLRAPQQPFSWLSEQKAANCARIDDATPDGGARLQSELRSGAPRQPVADRFPSGQHVRPERGKLVLHERVEPDLRHELSVPAVPGHVRALARERAERARPRVRRAVRQEIGHIEELAAFESVGRHEAFQPEDLRNLHLELMKARVGISALRSARKAHYATGIATMRRDLEDATYANNPSDIIQNR